ncbi:MAG: hemerythrin domain-containing protein [Candidatus Schekmanbacteria bacterium]|nr:hemerythrin domain-containing protein [Candidatus Schekmanbacteria bacterium]
MSTKRIIETHREIRAVLDRLARSCDLPEVCAILGDLGSLLPPHFADEERSDGFFARVVSENPNLDSRVCSLQRQHTDITADVASLESDVRDYLERAVARFFARRDALVELLRAHEDAENSLVMDAFLTDLGGSE